MSSALQEGVVKLGRILRFLWHRFPGGTTRRAASYDSSGTDFRHFTIPLAQTSHRFPDRVSIFHLEASSWPCYRNPMNWELTS